MMFSLYIPVEDSDEETKIKLFPTLLLLKKKKGIGEKLLFSLQYYQSTFFLILALTTKEASNL